MQEFISFETPLWPRLLQLLEYNPAEPLTLTTGFFLFAFMLFGFGYSLVKGRARLRTLYVVFVSLYFYYKLSGAYILLLLFVAISDYIIGGCVGRRREKGRETRWFVALSVVINVAILVYFKATNFFVDVVNGLYGTGTLDIESVVVPAGVSFFVFQSIAYVVDIARGTIAPLRRFGDYLFMLSFFPKMFLGPLVKAKEFIPQIEAESVVVTREDFGRAISLIVGGLVKYAVIAKAIGILFVSPAFAGELGDSGLIALVAIYGFTLQIYCDFSGYSDIAQGVALVMGFKLPDNFNAPYHSATITEFWRRWHISLSTWLKDYLYISLGGNRKGKFCTYLNLVITMFLGGLWHGVGVTFILWGLLHGVALALHKVWLSVVPKAKAVGSEMKPLWRVLGVFVTFHIVAFGWLLFTAEDMSVVGSMLDRIVNNFTFNDFGTMVEGSWVALLLMVVGYLMHLTSRGFDEALRRSVVRIGVVGQLLLIIVAIWLVMQTNLMLEAATGVAGGLPMYAAF